VTDAPKCSVEGCDKTCKKAVYKRKDGRDTVSYGKTCTAHYAQAKKKEKTEPVGDKSNPNSAHPDGDDALINSIIGGQPIVSPPDKPKGQKGKEGEDPSKQPAQQAALPAFPPSLWMMLGNMLNKALKTHAYDLDEASAKYLSDSLTLMLQEQNVKMSPTYAFIIAIGMWLGLGTVQFMLEKSKGPDAKDETPKKGWDVPAWLNRRREAPKKIKDYVEATPESPQQEMVEVPAEQARLLNLQRPVPLTDPQKIVPIDLEAMEELSRKEMLKVEMELKKKERDKNR